MLILGPAITTDLADAEARLGRRLPAELRKLLLRTIGCQTNRPIGLAGQFGGIALPRPLTRSILWDDGFGDSFIDDVGGDDADPARMLFSCHDPPVTVLVTASITRFLARAARAELGEPGPLDQLDSWLRRFSDAGPGSIVDRGRVSVLGPDQRGTVRFSRESLPGDGFWWGASDRGEIAARRVDDAATFELWRA